jgi:hypothetical protein
MSKIHDGMWNTGAPHHNHAALIKVRALMPSSGLCFKFMMGCGIQTPLITIMHHFLKVRALVPSSGSCRKFMTGCGIQAPLITIMKRFKR